MRHCLRFLLLLVCLGTTLTAHAQPLLWHVEGKHNTVYLLGAIHALRDSDYPLPSVVQRAYAQADAVVVEVDPAALKSLSFSRQALKLGKFSDGRRLRDVVAPSTYTATRAAAVKLGLSPARLEHFQPWLAAITLNGLKIHAVGFQSALGVDSVLGTRAHHDHKRVIGLESPEFQLQLFASMPGQEQEAFLRQSLDDLNHMQSSLQKLVRIWRDGDVAALTQLQSDEFADAPGLYHRLLLQRNQTWLPRIKAYLDDSRDYLIVVGAMHLVGPDGLIQELKSEGFRLRRL